MLLTGVDTLQKQKKAGHFKLFPTGKFGPLPCLILLSAQKHKHVLMEKLQLEQREKQRLATDAKESPRESASKTAEQQFFNTKQSKAKDVKLVKSVMNKLKSEVMLPNEQHSDFDSVNTDATAVCCTDTHLNELLNWGRTNAVWPLTYNLCNTAVRIKHNAACSYEMHPFLLVLKHEADCQAKQEVQKNELTAPKYLQEIFDCADSCKSFNIEAD